MMTVGQSKGDFKSRSNLLSHTVSWVAVLTAASDVDKATMACSLLSQLTGPPAIINDYQLWNGDHHSHQPSQHQNSLSNFHYLISGILFHNSLFPLGISKFALLQSNGLL